MCKTKNGAESRLVRINEPILRIPNLAIHLTARSDRDAFRFDTETQTIPCFATVAAAELSKGSCGDTESIINDEHQPLLLRLIAEELSIDVDDILDFELYLYDTQPSAIGGGLKEFIFSPRLDNLCSTYSTLTALGIFSFTSFLFDFYDKKCEKCEN